MSKFNVQNEARERQGTTLSFGGNRYQFLGTPSSVEFRQGAEGLVQPVVDPRTGKRYRVKCFFDPSDQRRLRSTLLVQQQLAKAHKHFADSLGGAPFEVVQNVGPHTPFAVVMKEIQGESWDRVKEKAKDESRYPPSMLPSLQVRATWAYGLASAVKQMETHDFIHADIAHGNIMVIPNGDLAGSMALVDFDAFVHPMYPYLETSCLGTAGYAAPEVNLGDSQRLKVGTDRVGMAILIQEFLLYGDPDLRDPESFLRGYDQHEDVNGYRPIAHPLFESKYPEMAGLLKSTLGTANPNSRPAPEQWRNQLYLLAGGRKAGRPAMLQVRLSGFPVAKPELNLEMPDLERRLDLSATKYGLHVTLERDALGAVDAVVPAGVKVRYRPQNGMWTEAAGSCRIPITPGLVLVQASVQSGVSIQGVEHAAKAKVAYA